MADDNSDSRPERGIDESGFSIPLKQDEVEEFFEVGDLASGGYLNLFENVGSELNDRIKSDGNVSFLALSLDGERFSRNFTVFQIAHYLSRLDRKVLIVDIDFLEPGLSGIVGETEDYGFLDLLLYGSSLKSVAKPSGIDNVGIIGTGSFPVTKTVPFARKEFRRINGFLLDNSDAIIYCSTLYTDEGDVNPLSEFADGVILSCRIEETEEGELQKSISGLEDSGVKSIETVCLCSGENIDPEVPCGAEVHEELEEEEGEAEDVEEEDEQDLEEVSAEDEVAEEEPVFIEKTEELDSDDREPEKKFDIFRLGAVIVAVLIIAFVVWWVMWGSIKEDDRSAEITSEAVRKMKDVRDEIPGREEAAGEAVEEADSSGSADESTEQPAGGEEDERSAEAASAEEKKDLHEAGTYFAVHVASFRDSTRAGREREYFEKLGYEVHVRKTEVKGQVWYRILVGRFGTEEEARIKRTELAGVERVGYARVRKIEIN